MEKTCVKCGNLFTTNYKQQRYCSLSCRQLICKWCGKTFYRKGSHGTYCSITCKGEHQKVTRLGTENPNYGNRWPKEKRKIQSELIKSKVDDEYRYKTGKANRGVKFSEGRIKAMHSKRTPQSYSRPHTKETKLKIGRKSKDKFTKEFKHRFRKIMEAMDYWTPLSEKGDKEIYYTLSNWVRPMFDIVEDPENLLTTFGVFNATENPFGVVRDHIVGRSYGFRYQIFPEILRHPCNCQIILARENVIKAQSGDKDDLGITIENLYNLIKDYDKPWHEQEVVLYLIKEYENGKRWERKEVKCVSETRT